MCIILECFLVKSVCKDTERKLTMWGVLDLVNFGCFASGRCERYHCNGMRKPAFVVPREGGRASLVPCPFVGRGRVYLKGVGHPRG